MKSWNIAVTWIFRPSNSSLGDLPFLFGMFLPLAHSPPVLSSTVCTGVRRTHSSLDCISSNKWQSYQSEIKPRDLTICPQSAETEKEHSGLHRSENGGFFLEQPEPFLQLVFQPNWANWRKESWLEMWSRIQWLSSDCRWENILEGESSPSFFEVSFFWRKAGSAHHLHNNIDGGGSIGFFSWDGATGKGWEKSDSRKRSDNWGCLKMPVQCPQIVSFTPKRGKV